MADIFDIDLQVKKIKELEDNLRHARKVCERLKKDNEPDNWSWVTIHAGNNDEIHLAAGEHPAIGRGWMVQFIEDYIMDPLFKEREKETLKLREMISEEYL